MLTRKSSSKSGAFRYKSIEPAKKIYGRLDFLGSPHQTRLSRSFAKSESRRVLLSRSSSIDRQTKRKLVGDSNAQDSARRQDEVASQSSRTIDLGRTRRLQEPSLPGLRALDNPESGSHRLDGSLGRCLDHHSPGSCLCHECTCGRHLCKFQTLTPRASLQMDSVYRKEYARREPMPRLAFKPAADSTLKSPAVDMDSSYLREYRDRFPGRPQRPVPDDNLEFKGPQVQLSDYRKEFPGFRGDNQYVPGEPRRSSPRTGTTWRGCPSRGRRSTASPT